MSAVDNLADSLNRINLVSPHQAWLAERNSRNLQCMPSDEEEEDDDDEDDDDDRTDQKPLAKITSTKVKSNIPLPSDEEDNTDDEVEEEDDEDDDVLLPIGHNNAMKRPIHGALPFRNNRSAPSLPHQFEQQQAYMQQQHSDASANSSTRIIEGNNRSVSTDNLSRLVKDEDDQVIGQHLRHIDAPPQPMHQYHQYQKHQHLQQQLAQFHYLQQQQNGNMQTNNNRNQKQQQQHVRMAAMSGMDLLIQREQEKAEAKRQKPKLNTSKVKIEGLLGKLPEPGTHNINFQQIQQQYMNTTSAPKKHNRQQQQQQQQQQAYGYAQPPASYGYMPTPPAMMDYYNNGRSSVPPMNNMYGQPSFYQMPNYMSNSSLYMMANPNHQQQQPTSRPASTVNPKRTTPISFSQQ